MIIFVSLLLSPSEDKKEHHSKSYNYQNNFKISFALNADDDFCFVLLQGLFPRESKKKIVLNLPQEFQINIETTNFKFDMVITVKL